MVGLATIGLAAALLVAQDTDTTFAAAGATQIEVSGAAGSVVVRAWDRDEIRVVAEHARSTEIEIRRRADAWRIGTERRWGGGIADYEITVPRGYDVTVGGMYFSLDVEGVGGAVEAQSIEGDMRIVGGRGDVDLNAINGRVTVEESEGTIHLKSAAESMELRALAGEVMVEAIGGNVTLSEMSASKVEVRSVGGNVRYEGVLSPGGEYVLSSHGGNITVQIPEGTNADVWVATVMGNIDVDLPGVAEVGEGRRREFRLGTGGAELDLETFGGRISLRRTGAR
ncbi:MAG: hypothetical protein R3E10_15480 [Gemmatimonadota bacterium]